MLKKIKNFFKWIADRTGISWILGKISSGWKSSDKTNQASGVSQPKSQGPDQSQNSMGLEKPHSNGNSVDSQANVAQPKEPDELPVIASIYENTNGVLELFVTINHTGKVFGGGVGISGNGDLNLNEIMDKLKYRVYIKCNKGVFQITCNKLIEAGISGAFLNIESVASQDSKALSSEVEGMKRMLGLSNEHAASVITQISQDPIAPEVPANNSEALSSEAANIVNNNEPNKLLENPSKEQLMWSKLIIPRF